MKNLSIRNKLILSFAGLVILIIPIAIFVASSLTQVRSEFDTVTDFNVPVVLALGDLQVEGVQLILSTNEFILDQTLEGEGLGEEEDIAEATENYEAALARFQSLEDDAQDIDAALITEIETSGQTLLELIDDALTQDYMALPSEDVGEIRERLEEAEETFLAATSQALDTERANLATANENVNEAVNGGLIAVLVAATTVIAALALVGVVLYRSISRPLKKLQETAEAIRFGRMEARSGLTTEDEFGQLSQTLDVMANQIRQSMEILRDQVDETAQAYAEAERSNEVKSAFLASMSHELRTPMNAVINFTKFVANGDLGPVNDQQKETLNEVIDSSKHLLSLINDVLDMSKIESGSLRLFVVEDVDINKILEQVVSTGKSLKTNGVEINTEYPSDLPQMRGDRQRILQVLLNIMSNAAKFTEKGSITVKATQDDDQVVIAIQDTGSGIAQDDQDAVFEPFKQTQSGLRKGSGTGLGMPIAKNLVEIHGGRLWLESEPEQGTTFFVAIPIKAAHLTPTIAAQGVRA